MNPNSPGQKYWRVGAFGWIALAFGAALVAGIWWRGGWLHSGLVPASQAVWSPACNQSVPGQLNATFVDRLPFESSSHRLRPLSGLTGVVDAIRRPLRVFGLHPSLSLSAFLLAVATAAGFHPTRRGGRDVMARRDCFRPVHQSS